MDKIDVRENVVEYHYDSERTGERESFTVKRSRVMPKDHTVEIEDARTHHANYPHMFQSMLWTIFASAWGQNWVVGNRKLLEKEVDRFFDYFGISRRDANVVGNPDRAANAFRAVFDGSNIDQQAGLTVMSCEDSQRLSVFEDFTEDDLHVCEAEDGLGFRLRLRLLYWIYRTRRLNRMLQDDDSHAYRITLMLKAYPHAEKFGFNYDVSVDGGVMRGEHDSS